MRGGCSYSFLGQKIVLGLHVDGAAPRLRKQYDDRIRQHRYFIEKHGPVRRAFERKFESTCGMKAHVKGLIDFAKMIEPDYAEVCNQKFQRIDCPV